MIPPFGCAMTRSFGLDPSNNTLPLRRCRPTPCSTWPISVLERYPGLNLFGCEGAANHQMDSYLFRKQNAVFLFVQVISSNVRVRKDPGLSYQHFISSNAEQCSVHGRKGPKTSLILIKSCEQSAFGSWVRLKCPCTSLKRKA